MHYSDDQSPQMFKVPMTVEQMLSVMNSGGSWGNSLVGLVMAPLKATFFCVSRARDRTIYIREIVGVINFRKK